MAAAEAKKLAKLQEKMNKELEKQTAQALKELGVKEIYSIKKMKHYPMRVTQKAKAIRKEGENWLDAIQRAKKRKRV